MKKLNVAFTFDYELFFGENKGSYSSVLFEPTKLLIDVLYEKGVSATFFADTCSLVQAEKYNQQEYIKGFKNQLLYMLEKNQDVQLHIHPHWLNSTFDGENWHFENEAYRIHSFGFDNIEEGANKIIKDGVDCLNNLLLPSYPEYRCIAFRAGGFCLQPHVELVKILYEHGIRIDSSVAPQLKSDDQSHAYDYRKRELATNWFVSSDGEWWEDKKAGTNCLFEVPVATIDKNPVFFTYDRLLHPESIKLTLEEMRGTYINSCQIVKRAVFGRIWNYVSGYNAISLDAYQAGYIMQQLDRLINKGGTNEYNKYVAIIGHPKLVTHNYIENIKRVIELIKKDSRIELVNIAEIWKKEGFGDGQ